MGIYCLKVFCLSSIQLKLIFNKSFMDTSNQVTDIPANTAPIPITQAPKIGTSKNKTTNIILTAFVALALLILIGAGLFFLTKDRNKGTTETTANNNTQTTSVNTTDSGEKTCVYTDNNLTISFRIPKNWECIEDEYPAGNKSITLKYTNIEFWVGFLFQAGWQNVSGNCQNDIIY